MAKKENVVKWLAFVMGGAWVGAAQAQSMKVCVDDNTWYPFLFQEKGEAKGIHYDLVELARKKVGVKFMYEFRSWDRCLKDGELGRYDAIMSASFKSDRTAHFFYPQDALNEGKPCTSKSRITCVTYSVVSLISKSFEYGGKMEDVPAPVRLVKGYSLVGDFEKIGKDIDFGPSDLSGLKKMLRDGNGVTVMLAEQAEKYNREGELSGKFYISKTPLTKKSYYLIFSQKGRVGNELMGKIWDALAEISSDPKTLAALYERYQ